MLQKNQTDKSVKVQETFKVSIGLDWSRPRNMHFLLESNKKESQLVLPYLLKDTLHVHERHNISNAVVASITKISSSEH